MTEATLQRPRAARQSLSDVRKGSPQLPSRLIVHGQAGIGKTAFAANAPSPLFLLSPGETGLHALMDSGLIGEVPNIEISEWEAFMQLLHDLGTTDHGYKSVVLDTLDGFEKVANTYVCIRDFKGDWGEKGFIGFQRGPNTVAQGPWREMLAALDKIREKKISVICLAHTSIANFSNPSGADFNRFTPDMSKPAWNLSFGWCDICLFGFREIVTVKERGDRSTKGRGGQDRVFQTTYDAAADAKNRHNLPETISMGQSGQEAYVNFTTAVKEAKKQKGAQ